MGEVTLKLKSQVTEKGEVGAQVELFSGCTDTHDLRGCLKESPIFHFETVFMTVAVPGLSFFFLIMSGLAFSLLFSVYDLAIMFTVSSFLSGSLSSLLCHDLNV